MEYDLTKPIEIAEDVYWVGYVVPDDPFQCHVYLIKNGKESILIDPGSKIVLPVVLEKIVSLVPLRDIKYIIFHHQDPDITGSFEILEQLFPEGERYVITHWRSATLLKHYNWKTPFWLVDKHDWKLNANGRELEFIFTPYAHFPGAFVTYDKKTGVLFSSDIFGAISDKFMLFAEDTEDYYEGVELFHKHYMPSNMILNYALDRIEEKHPDLIAPQHGSIIQKHMIKPIIDRLRKLDCGLYLLDDKYVDIFLLNKLDVVLNNIIQAVVTSYDFRSLIAEIYYALKNVIEGIKGIAVKGFYADGSFKIWQVNSSGMKEFQTEVADRDDIVFHRPLMFEDKKVGEIYMFADDITEGNKRLLDMLYKHIHYALAVNLKKEMDLELIEKEKESWEKSAEIDPLTGVYNRRYMERMLQKILRDYKEFKPISMLFIDIDHFKRVNDTYGHLAGDKVLQELASVLKAHFRDVDIVARYGGEEFVVIMMLSDLLSACKKAEQLRQIVENMRVKLDDGREISITISIGVTMYREGEDIRSFIGRADANLYTAKNSGRNRVVCK